MLRTGTRGYDVLVSLHHMPNYTRVILPPMAGLDGAGGWRELDLTFLPVDDLTNRWFITNLVGADGAAREAYLAKRNTYCGQRAAIGPAEDLAREVREGRVRFQDIGHSDRVRVQDIAVQAGQGPIPDRSNKWLGRSDRTVILWRAFWGANSVPRRKAGPSKNGRRLRPMSCRSSGFSPVGPRPSAPS